MFCNKCGSQLPNESGFCPGCGAKVEIAEKTIGLDTVCSSCGEELIPGNKFCIKCGNPIKEHNKFRQTTNSINTIPSSTINAQGDYREPLTKEIILTENQKNSLITKAGVIASIITLPLCIVIGEVVESLGYNDIIVLPVFIVCFPLLYVTFYKRLKRDILK